MCVLCVCVCWGEGEEGGGLSDCKRQTENRQAGRQRQASRLTDRYGGRDRDSDRERIQSCNKELSHRTISRSDQTPGQSGPTSRPTFSRRKRQGGEGVGGERWGVEG